MFKSSIIFIDGKLKSYFDIIFMANNHDHHTVHLIYLKANRTDSVLCSLA